MADQSFSRTFVLSPVQDIVVKSVAKKFEGNESMALRYIINEYARLDSEVPTAEPAPLFADENGGK